jgi:hypothetical protein
MNQDVTGIAEMQRQIFTLENKVRELERRLPAALAVSPPAQPKKVIEEGARISDQHAGVDRVAGREAARRARGDRHR